MNEERLNEKSSHTAETQPIQALKESALHEEKQVAGGRTELTLSPGRPGNPDLICFSHLRWDFVFQRPQHLLTRAMRQFRVFFFEEPIWDDRFRLETRAVGERLWVGVPHIPGHWSEEQKQEGLRQLVDQMLERFGIRRYMGWYYTPMALSFTDHLKPQVTVFDCMDELSAFRGAPPQLLEMERRLMSQADLVLTGGQSLFEARRHRHHNIHPFPSSIDRAHFGQARQPLPDPSDQRIIKGPRLGFFGVLDERFDIDLLTELARRRPEWQFIMLGPVVKIDPASLPRFANVHYLGMKSYSELPSYVAHWDVAMLPFAINESTKFISPTKTPEYLAAGKPVVSTPIRDVVRPYGEKGLVAIADSADAFERDIEACLSLSVPARRRWLQEVDAYLSTISWDQTWTKIHQLISEQMLVKAIR